MGKENSNPKAPDGGWGYLCVIGMTQSMLLFGLAVRSYGVIYLITLEKFETTATIASWIGATNILVFGIVSPFAALLCQKCSCRLVAIIGTTALAAGFILSAYAVHVAMMYVSFGLICGVGISCTTTAGFLIVSQYFEKKRAFALSLGSAGASLSVFIMPPLTEFLFNYYGYQGAMLILAGISLQGYVSGALFKPMDKYDIPKPKNIENGADENLKLEIIKETTNKNEENTQSKTNNIQDKDLIKPLIYAEKEQPAHKSNINDSSLNKTIEQSNDDPKINNNCFNNNSTIELLKNPLLMGIIVVNIGMTIVATTANTFAPALAVDEGVDEMWAVLLLSWAGLGDTIGRITIGFFMDRKNLRPYRLYIYTACAVIGSAAVFIYPILTHYGWFSFSMVLYESNIGVLFAQRTTVLVDVIGMKKMPLMFGALQTINAIGITFGRGIGGIIKDVFGVYSYIFYFSGVLSFICYLAMIIILVFAARNKTYPNKDLNKGFPLIVTLRKPLPSANKKLKMALL